MLNSHELAFPSFQAALLEPQPSFSSRNLKIWKILLVLTLIIFSAVQKPNIEAAEKSFSTETILTILNQDRSKNGLVPYKANLQLAKAAQAKARHILNNNYFAHTSPSGVEPWSFIADTGLVYAFAGENLALNYSSAYELEMDFLQSPLHRENLLSPLFTDIGIAVVRGTFQGQTAVITVQMFASPTRVATAPN